MPPTPPPHNIDAEKSVLGAIILSPPVITQVIDILGNTGETLFYATEHRCIYDAMTTLHSKGVSPDIITLMSQLEDSGSLGSIVDIAYLSDLSSNVPTSSNVKHYAKIVLDLSSRRMLIRECDRLKVLAHSSTEDVGSLLYEAESSIYSIGGERKHVSITVNDNDSVLCISEVPPIPEELMTIPGFVDDYMSYIDSVSVYKNKSMAFAGSVAMMSYMMGRSVQDALKTRPNIYILGLAESGAGKDMPRKMNKKLGRIIGLYKGMADTFASWEGVEDALVDTPTMFYQTDEMDSMLSAMSSGKEGRYEGLIRGLLTTYTSSNSWINRRRLAKNANTQSEHTIIRNPFLTLFGTAIPQNYYAALSEAMLSNGFFSRQFIIENVSERIYNTSVDLVSHAMPDNLITIGKWWGDSSASRESNFDLTEPFIVPIDARARELRLQQVEYYDSKWSEAKESGDRVGTAVWTRAGELQNTLALIYACSECHEAPVISVANIEWTNKIVMIANKRMLYQANEYVYSTQHDKYVKEVTRIIREAGEGAVSKSHLMRKLRGLKAHEMDAVLQYMDESGLAKIETRKTGGRPIKFVTLV